MHFGRCLRVVTFTLLAHVVLFVTMGTAWYLAAERQAADAERSFPAAALDGARAGLTAAVLSAPVVIVLAAFLAGRREANFTHGMRAGARFAVSLSIPWVGFCLWVAFGGGLAGLAVHGGGGGVLGLATWGVLVPVGLGVLYGVAVGAFVVWRWRRYAERS